MATEKSSKDTSMFKPQYRTLKRRFKFLVYENECYQEELRNLQRKLLKLSRDKNFLLDRLLQFEKVSDSSDDSDAHVEPSESVEVKKQPKAKEGASKKKRPKLEKSTSETSAAVSTTAKPSGNKSRSKKAPTRTTATGQLSTSVGNGENPIDASRLLPQVVLEQLVIPTSMAESMNVDESPTTIDIS